MSIKHFCDGCGEETERNFVGTDLLIHAEKSRHEFEVRILVGEDVGVAKGETGDLCDVCLLKIICNAPEFTGQSPRKPRADKGSKHSRSKAPIIKLTEPDEQKDTPEMAAPTEEETVQPVVEKPRKSHRATQNKQGTASGLPSGTFISSLKLECDGCTTKGECPLILQGDEKAPWRKQCYDSKVAKGEIK